MGIAQYMKMMLLPKRITGILLVACLGLGGIERVDADQPCEGILCGSGAANRHAARTGFLVGLAQLGQDLARAVTDRIYNSTILGEDWFWGGMAESHNRSINEKFGDLVGEHNYIGPEEIPGLRAVGAEIFNNVAMEAATAGIVATGPLARRGLRAIRGMPKWQGGVKASSDIGRAFSGFGGAANPNRRGGFGRTHSIGKKLARPVPPVNTSKVDEMVSAFSRKFGHEPEEVWILGSHARGKARASSDIDVMFVSKEFAQGGNFGSEVEKWEGIGFQFVKEANPQVRWQAHGIEGLGPPDLNPAWDLIGSDRIPKAGFIDPWFKPTSPHQERGMGAVRIR